MKLPRRVREKWPLRREVTISDSRLGRWSSGVVALEGMW
jgi:hypothetical protein